LARLHTRIYLHFVAVLVLVGLVTVVVFAFGAREAFRRMMAERLTRHVAALVVERVDDRAALAARLAEIHDHLGIDVAVRDRDGRLLAWAGDPLPSVPGHDAVGRGARPLTATPLRAPSTGELVGVVLTAPPHPMQIHPMGMPPLWRPLIVLAVALLGVAIATRPLARRISRPVERLTDAARRLGGGDLAARVPEPTHGADEIAELTQAFNDMALRVERLVRGEKELLANVSHELRSPLTRIRMALALLPNAGDSARRIADVERDLADLDRLVEDVLTTARLEATGLPTHLANVDVGALLADLAERARHDPVTAETTVHIEDGGSIDLTADEALLRRALWNLVENAAKYGAPPITLAGRTTAEGVELSVTDAGPGIAAADCERVFAPFYRGDAARTPGGASNDRRGVGLGLTLARRVAEVHGGTIAIDPTARDGEGRGCRVIIALPRGPSGT
jgi:two-component system, OmpR family, sensor kinase